jgi:hypothetical protein
MTHDGRPRDSEIGPHRPDRMAGRVAQRPRQIAFNDMPQPTDRRPRTDQHNVSLSSTQQHRNRPRDRQTVLHDRAPAIDRVEVLSPMFSRKLVIRRNHPESIPQAGQPSWLMSRRMGVNPTSNRLGYLAAPTPNRSGWSPIRFGR